MIKAVEKKDLIQCRESGSDAIFLLSNCYQTSQEEVYFLKE